MDLVTIIVPVYNSENYLSKCIDSILSQSYQYLEIILIDDGSIDDSGIICDRYARKDERIKVIHIKNGGVSKARNLGISMSKGNYICFIDSDDSVDEKYIETLYQLYEKKMCDISLCNYNIVLHKGGFTKISNLLVDDLCCDLTFDYSKMTLFFSSPCAKMFKSEIIFNNNIKFNEEMSFGEDQHFCYQYLFYVKSYAFVNMPLYNYNKYDRISLSKNHTIEAYNWSVDRIKLEKKLIIYKGYKFENKILGQHALVIMHHFFKLENYNNDYADFKKRMMQLADIIDGKFDAFNWKFKIITYLLSFKLYFIVYCLYCLQYYKEYKS